MSASIPPMPPMNWQQLDPNSPAGKMYDAVEAARGGDPRALVGNLTNDPTLAQQIGADPRLGPVMAGMTGGSPALMAAMAGGPAGPYLAAAQMIAPGAVAKFQGLAEGLAGPIVGKVSRLVETALGIAQGALDSAAGWALAPGFKAGAVILDLFGLGDLLGDDDENAQKAAQAKQAMAAIAAASQQFATGIGTIPGLTVIAAPSDSAGILDYMKIRIGAVPLPVSLFPRPEAGFFSPSTQQAGGWTVRDARTSTPQPPFGDPALDGSQGPAAFAAAMAARVTSFLAAAVVPDGLLAAGGYYILDARGASIWRLGS